MKINGLPQRTIWFDEEQQAVRIIDQTLLPHHFNILSLNSLDAACHAITTMQVRGAPLIGVTAAFGVYLALRDGETDLSAVCERLLATRPTAVNLRWALECVQAELSPLWGPIQAGVSTVPSIEPTQVRIEAALALALWLADEDAAACSAIGDHGLELLQQAWFTKLTADPTAVSLNILTHCNAGWLATVDWGTALAPIYKAHSKGIPIHVWVDETRPRNQGAFLTAWELQQEGIPHTVIVDNAGGHLMQHGEVDLCIVGSDRTTATGDVCNKIGTYLKALAAFDNDIPFYVALPVSTIDFSLSDGVKEIPIEQRHGSEVSHIQGLNELGELSRVQVMTSHSAVNNFGFDVTPARLVTALITERGVFAPNRESLQVLAPL
ncbi:MAG: S-methyl-5-thioribose-1-phosphate isomerase [Gammaproteobacteria bacterium]|nr:S-methyl-5-thioribose-1-phosphate isomerase [Gammaproteobacteria bacterium]MDP2141678.1 S-methyl-5-thioribose-1-phosphate isomerase [Gammaproteobacteria bacterium]MDP2347913.1 S-methyl-5-thioribose-1-phosphate isomerase [Gammaproteobacteria bacterium]